MKNLVIGILLLVSSHAVLAEQHRKSDKTGFFVALHRNFAFADIRATPKKQSATKTTYASGRVLPFIVGYNIRDWVGLEAAIFLSLSDITDKNTGRDAMAGGFYLMPKFTRHFNDNFSAYVKAGISRLSYDQDGRERSTSDSTDNARIYRREYSDFVPAIGAGVQRSIAYGFKIRLDYFYAKGQLARAENTEDKKYFTDEMEVSFSMLNLSLGYQF